MRMKKVEPPVSSLIGKKVRLFSCVIFNTDDGDELRSCLFASKEACIDAAFAEYTKKWDELAEEEALHISDGCFVDDNFIPCMDRDAFAKCICQKGGGAYIQLSSYHIQYELHELALTLDEKLLRKAVQQKPVSTLAGTTLHLFGYNAASAEGFGLQGNETKAHIFSTRKLCADSAYLDYKHTWDDLAACEELERSGRRYVDANGSPRMTRKDFVACCENGGADIQLSSYHIIYEMKEYEVLVDQAFLADGWFEDKEK